MAFQQGLSGLSAASKALDVTSNNVANSATVGFKSATTNFSSIYANALAGSVGSQTGIGASVTAIAQQFTQGNLTTTSNPLDVAINGNGFFVLSDKGAPSYTRSGQFQLDKAGNIVTSTGENLQGYQVDSANKVTGAVGDLKLNTADIDPKPTAVVSPLINLDSRQAVPAGAAFPATLTAVVPATVPVTYVQPTTDMYNSSTSTPIFDSLGNPHVATLYFTKTAAAGTWNVNGIIDGGAANAGAVLAFEDLVFDTSGTLTSPVGPPTGLGLTPLVLAWTDPSVDATQTLNLNFNGTTQFGSNFSVNALSQDGYTAGHLAGFDIAADGVLQGRYTNGQTNTLGQVALANFTNPQGLLAIGSNQWMESPLSGAPLVGTPGSSSLGVLQSAAIEESNVDLTQELVNMITQQRNYQASAQTIKTQDQIMQTLVNLR